MKISVIGAGSWGTTLANLIASKGTEVNLWVREEDVFRQIQETKENKQFLPGVKLSDNIIADHNFDSVVRDSDMIITAVPSQFTRITAKNLAPLVKEGITIVNVSKGLELPSYKRMTEVIEEEIPGSEVVALSGPNHAEEVSRKIPTATVIASRHEEVLPKVKEVFETDYFKVYPHHDIIGVELGGALKNITAVCVGVCEGLGLGDNAKGALMTLGFSEMITVGKSMGAKMSTFTGLAGLGDLICTATSKHSRNWRYGNMLAQGLTPEEINEKIHGMVAEGVKVTPVIHEYAKQNGLDLHLVEQTYKVLYENKDVKDAIKDLIDLI